MHENEVVRRAFAMPLTNPAYPPGPYRLRPDVARIVEFPIVALFAKTPAFAAYRPVVV